MRKALGSSEAISALGLGIKMSEGFTRGTGRCCQRDFSAQNLLSVPHKAFSLCIGERRCCPALYAHADKSQWKTLLRGECINQGKDATRPSSAASSASAPPKPPRWPPSTSRANCTALLLKAGRIERHHASSASRLGKGGQLALTHPGQSGTCEHLVATQALASFRST